MKTKLTSSFRLIRFFNSLSSSSSIVFCETLDFVVKKTSMAEEVAENVNAVPVSEDELYGFKRSEMYSGTLAGSVGPYGRHVFLCYKSHETWLPRVETEGLPQRFAKSFKDRKADFGVEVSNTNVFRCEESCLVFEYLNLCCRRSLRCVVVVNRMEMC